MKINIHLKSITNLRENLYVRKHLSSVIKIINLQTKYTPNSKGNIFLIISYDSIQFTPVIRASYFMTSDVNNGWRGRFPFIKLNEMDLTYYST